MKYKSKVEWKNRSRYFGGLLYSVFERRLVLPGGYGYRPPFSEKISEKIGEKISENSFHKFTSCSRKSSADMQGNLLLLFCFILSTHAGPFSIPNAEMVGKAFDISRGTSFPT